MSDLYVSFSCDQGLQTDLALVGGDLRLGNELTTAICMCLFTDARARPDDELPAGSDPRGWWADALDGVRYGSRLWLLENARALPETLSRARTYALESLQVLIDEGVAQAVDVLTAYLDDCKGVMVIAVSVTKPTGEKLNWRWRYAWDSREVIACETNEELNAT